MKRVAFILAFCILLLELGYGVSTTGLNSNYMLFSPSKALYAIYNYDKKDYTLYKGVSDHVKEKTKSNPPKRLDFTGNIANNEKVPFDTAADCIAAQVIYQIEPCHTEEYQAIFSSNPREQVLRVTDSLCMQNFGNTIDSYYHRTDISPNMNTLSGGVKDTAYIGEI